MAVNKIIFGAQTLIDLTNDTVTQETLAEGKTAHNKAGEIITGTMQGEKALYGNEPGQISTFELFMHGFDPYYKK